MTEEQWSAHVKMMVEILASTLKNRSCTCCSGHDQDVDARREAASDLRLVLDKDMCPDWMRVR